MYKPTNLRCLTWNANGILDKKEEFFQFLVKNLIDVATISETFLKPSMRLSHPKYNIYRLDRLDRIKGGVAVVIGKHIKHQEVRSRNLKCIEAIGISIETCVGRLEVFACYNPGANTDCIGFKEDIRKLCSNGSMFINCGDFNARHKMWKCQKANRMGIALFDEAQRGSFTINHPTDPTYIPSDTNRSPSILDFVCTNIPQKLSELLAINQFSSDHLPVIFKVKLEKVCRNSICIPDYRRADWNLFRDLVNSNMDLSCLNLSHVISTIQIDDMVKTLSDTIKCAHDRSIPSSPTDQYNLILPEEVEELIKHRNSVRRLWQRTRSNKTLKILVTQLNNNIKAVIGKLRNNAWAKNLQSMNSPGDKRRLWRFAKIIRGGNSNIPPLIVDSISLTTGKDKCKALKAHFQAANQITHYSDSPLRPAVDRTVKDFLFANPSPSFTPGDLIRPVVIKNLISNLKNKLSTGPDGLNARTLKQLPPKALVYLTFIFNSCIKLAYFPVEWKRAKVIPIHKPQTTPSDPKNYRPISLLNNIGKIFEKVLAARIKRHIRNQNIIPEYQFGFQEGLATSHQAIRLIKKIKAQRNKKLATGLVLLDLEKAFDTVWHNGLIYKLINFNFPTIIIKLICSFLRNRECKVHINSNMSDPFTLPAGLPQGSALSPVLFNIFTADIPRLKNASRFAFADDFAICSSSKDPRKISKALSNGIARYMAYCTSWKLKVNENKTEAVFFSRCTSLRKLPKKGLKIQSYEIPWKNQVKYLGVYLDKRLTFKHHVDAKLLAGSKAIRALYSFINRKSKLSTQNQILLYKAIVRPIITYAAPVWADCAKTHKYKLQVFQNTCLKRIFNLPPWHSTTDLHRRADIPKITSFISSLSSNFSLKCRISHRRQINELVRN
uniref:Putative reverse transcriptase-like protein n=1 Tax=Anopheles darlingi TaxID=43151 RepID=A0A2M4CVF1_ANODA